MAALVRNSTDRVAVVAVEVTGYRVLDNGINGCQLCVLLSGVLPEVTFETADDIATLTPLVAAFISNLEAALA